jgi:hypothetical protein
MDKRKLNGRFFHEVALALWLLCMSSLAWADKYQDAIMKAFPGFQILSRSEFRAEIQKDVKGNPGLITGRFNNDDLEDFAAIIRDNSKQKTPFGAEYYRGMIVVCHAADTQRYTCQVLGTRAISLPNELYLYRVGPGFNCRNDDGTESGITVKRDAIGTAMVPSNAASVDIYMPDGKYFNCAGD